ncbi:actin-binding protein WASF3 isoform X2 [Brachyhypopomus gauderio]|uniref:actin-binding protein WASF3 isoform X2 n=1 Tax=Brachyhypopomus gauderio TaxID=698409 RepID=UPI0040425035
MPLGKRSVHPRHLCRAVLPDGISSELECVTNTTFSAIIHQLSSLISLQDINMRKAFRSVTLHDQQVVSKSNIPNSVAEMYNSSDKPPSLNILSEYRDDHIEAMKFYTDPSYYFDLWMKKRLQEMENMRKERGRAREQKPYVDRTMSQDVIKVRKAHNRRHQWNMMVLDKELRPSCSPHHQTRLNHSHSSVH